MESPDENALARLYPDLSPEDLLQTAANLDRYLSVALSVYEFVLSDSEARARFDALNLRAKKVKCHRSTPRGREHPQ